MKKIKLLIFIFLLDLSFSTYSQNIIPHEASLQNSADIESFVPLEGVSVKSIYTDTLLFFLVDSEADVTGSYHNHSNEQVMLIHSGKVHAVVGEEEYELVAGDVLVIPSYVPHQFTTLEESTYTEVHGPGFNNAPKWE